MRTISDLPVKNESKGKTYYHGIMATCRGTSQYSDTQYNFDDLEGYWEIGNGRAPGKGSTYILELATKPKTGANAKPGSFYCDIVSIRPATADEQESGAPGSSDDLWEPESPAPFPDNGGFANAQAIATEVVEEYRNPRDMEPQTEIRTPPEKDNVQTRIEIGMAFNAAYTLIAGDPSQWTDGDNAVLDLRILRDRIYHGIIQVPVAPINYCYEHEQKRIQSKSGAFIHKLGEQWCSVDGILDATGNPVTEGE